MNKIDLSQERTVIREKNIVPSKREKEKRKVYPFFKKESLLFIGKEVRTNGKGNRKWRRSNRESI